MPHNKPIVTTHREPFFHPNVAPEEQHQTMTEYKRNVAVAANEAAEREMAYLRALNPPRVPQVEPPQLRQPVLPDGFDAAAIDEAIFRKGIGVSRDRVLALGKERFAELLARDGDVRSYQRVLLGDLTSWPAVAMGFAAVNALRSNVPPRKTKEQWSGQGADREQAAQINGWEDLWKVTSESESVRLCYAFHDCFTSLVFGQSLLEQIGSDSRVRSRLFCGGKFKGSLNFTDWLGALEGNHFKVVIVQPLFSIVAWVTGETAPPPQDLAFDWLGKKSPTPAETKRVQAVMEGWVLGLDSWALWDYVGKSTRRAVDLGVLDTWRKQLAGRYPAISRFHEHLRGFFWKPVGADGYHRFDATAYHSYLSRQTQRLLDAVSLLTAVAIEETVKGALVARFQDWLLIEGPKPKSVPTADRIECKLSAAFPGARFDIKVEAL